MTTPTPTLPLLRDYRVVWHLAGDPTTRSTPLTILARELDEESARDVLAGIAQVDPSRVEVRRVVLRATYGAMDADPEDS